MAVHTISLVAQPASLEQSRSWCAQLEAGGILYFPQTPVPIPAADLDFLLGCEQRDSRLHKNIAYKPNLDALSGVDRSAATAEAVDRLHDVMRRYSVAVAGFLADFLAPYGQRWQLDYASFRPIEEKGRDLPLRRRNDLLHTDAFPTRPTGGARILRFFHNIHPTRTRDWVVGEPFPRVVEHFVRSSSAATAAGGVAAPQRLPLPRPETAALRAVKHVAASTPLAGLIPSLKRTPYDQFMMRLHNAMKEDADFQRTCTREQYQFAPGSSWMVYTETVPHAVLGGQYALEQTFLVDPAAMVTPESAPIAVLEKMSAARTA